MLVILRTTAARVSAKDSEMKEIMYVNTLDTLQVPSEYGRSG